MKIDRSNIASTVLTQFLLVTLLALLAGCSGSEEPAAPAETTSAEPPAAETAAPPPAVIPVTTSSDEARALYFEGEYLSDVGRNVQAREKFLAAAEADPDFALAYYGISNTALSFPEFQHSLDTAVKHAEGISDGEKMMIDVNRSFLTNDSAKGLALAEELVEMYPQSERSWLVLAGMQANENDNEAARGSYMKALELNGNSPGALTGITVNYVQGEPKDFVAAEEWAKRFIAAYPEEAKGYEWIGDIKRAQNDLPAALEAYEAASKVDPTLELAAHKRGHVNSFLGDIEAARAAYDEAIAMAPVENKGSYAVYRGFTSIYGGETQAAIDELVSLADQFGDMGTPADQVKGLQLFALSSAAFAAMHIGNFDQAEQIIQRRNAIQKAIADEVGTSDAQRFVQANGHFFEGMLAAYRGDDENATAHANAIADLVEGDDNPRKLEGAHWVLGLSALKADDYPTAVEHLRQANHANNMMVRYHLAQAEEGMGNVETANELYAEIAVYNFNSVGFALIGKDASERVSG
jgi:tetratricopeptide (TPR) repeat protein